MPPSVGMVFQQNLKFECMKKWLLAIVLFALVVVETGCVVRVKERSRPYPTPSSRNVQ